MERVFGDDEDGGILVGRDPYDCEDCLAVGDDCSFHRGFAEGWDACGAFVARVVDGDCGESGESGEFVESGGFMEPAGGWSW